MGIALITFLFVGIVTFGAILFFLRPTTDEKALYQRFARIKADQNEFGAVVSGELEQYLKTRKTGQFGWVENIMESSDLARKIQVLILQANTTTTMGTVVAQMVGFGFVAMIAVYIFTKWLLVSVIAGVVFGYVPLAILRYKKGRRVRSFDAVLPDAIDMMGRSLRAGHSLPASIAIVAEQAPEPAKSEFNEVFKQQNYGLPMRDALMQMLQRVPSQDLRVVITGMLVQKDTGGNLAEILDRIAHVIRERVRIFREIRTHTAQGRMTGWILCLLPVVMLGLVNLLSPGYSKVLFEEGIGRDMLYIGVALLALGGFIIRSIINGIEV